MDSSMPRSLSYKGIMIAHGGNRRAGANEVGVRKTKDWCF